jgi:primase-polymerase (primpol)-like protein
MSPAFVGIFVLWEFTTERNSPEKLKVEYKDQTARGGPGMEVKWSQYP